MPFQRQWIKEAEFVPIVVTLIKSVFHSIAKIKNIAVNERLGYYFKSLFITSISNNIRSGEINR